jgi:hypothetical protein
MSILPWPKIAVRKIQTKITLVGRHQIDFDLIGITAVDLGLAIAKQETPNTTSCYINTVLAWFESQNSFVQLFLCILRVLDYDLMAEDFKHVISDELTRELAPVTNDQCL